MAQVLSLDVTVYGTSYAHKIGGIFITPPQLIRPYAVEAGLKHSNLPTQAHSDSGAWSIRPTFHHGTSVQSSPKTSEFHRHSSASLAYPKRSGMYVPYEPARPSWLRALGPTGMPGVVPPGGAPMGQADMLQNSMTMPLQGMQSAELAVGGMNMKSGKRGSSKKEGKA